MFLYSYREYLSFLHSKDTGKSLAKFYLLLVIFTFAAVSVFSILLYGQYRNYEAILVHNDYVSRTSSAFYATSQAFGEVIESMHVAGARSEKIGDLSEATASGGFFVSLDDSSRIIASLGEVRSQVESAQKNHESIVVPADLLAVDVELTNYWRDSQNLLKLIEGQHEFLVNLNLILGPDFYLPTISNEILWKSANVDEIRNYYQKINDNARSVLDNLNKLDVIGEFSEYKKAQVSYLEFVTKVSAEVVSLLEEEDSDDLELPRQLEKSYQIIVDSKIESESLVEFLNKEKQNIFTYVAFGEKLFGVLEKQADLEKKVSTMTLIEDRGVFIKLFYGLKL